MAKTHDEVDNPYEMLAAAIVKQALDDYVRYYRIKVRRRNAMRHYSYILDKHITSCERFFKSEWAMMLTDMDLPRIAEMIRREVEKNERQNEQNKVCGQSATGKRMF